MGDCGVCVCVPFLRPALLSVPSCSCKNASERAPCLEEAGLLPGSALLRCAGLYNHCVTLFFFPLAPCVTQQVPQPPFKARFWTPADYTGLGGVWKIPNSDFLKGPLGCTKGPTHWRSYECFITLLTGCFRVQELIEKVVCFEPNSWIFIRFQFQGKNRGRRLDWCSHALSFSVGVRQGQEYWPQIQIE